MSTTAREWRWINEPEPRPIPENWSKKGVEPCEDDEEHWYAVAFKAGTQLLWSIDQRTGDPVDGPHQEDQRIAVVYARSDCTRAVVRDYKAERAGGGWRLHAREYRAVRSFDPDAGGLVSARNRQDYLSVIEKHYGIKPALATVTGGESA